MILYNFISVLFLVIWFNILLISFLSICEVFESMMGPKKAYLATNLVLYIFALVITLVVLNVRTFPF